MKRSFCFLFFGLIFIIVSCTTDIETEPSITQIFSLQGTICQTDMDYPYLYISANTAGFWRIDLSSDYFDAIKLPLLDPQNNISQAKYIDAEDEDIIALTEGNVWRSISYGMVWHRSETGIDRIFTPTALSRSANSPRNICFVNSGDAIYTSSNWGESWTKGATIEDFSDYHESYWDPDRSEDIWFNGTYFNGKQFLKCYASSGGVERNIGLPTYNTNLWCSNLWYYNNTTYMYIHDSTGVAVIKSSDGGVNWSELDTDALDTLNIDHIYYDASNTGVLYLINNNQGIIYNSTNMLNSVNEIVALEQVALPIEQLYYEPIMQSLILITENKVYQIEF